MSKYGSVCDGHVVTLSLPLLPCWETYTTLRVRTLNHSNTQNGRL